ncbi:unnamed protein product [Paramecium primaurelia]|uniref:Uncharacterized protein n=1 Tax=Paramecium primaurelia TaxID=5886 RepID=A0A8S1LIH8_PARPR|nr:unnamed protein product [Paramecium primaurelia]
MKDLKIFPQLIWLLLAFNSVFFSCLIVKFVNLQIYIMILVLLGCLQFIMVLQLKIYY